MKYFQSIILFTLLCLSTSVGFAQTTTCFIKAIDLKEISKDAFMKADSISTESNNYRVFSYAIYCVPVDTSKQADFYFREVTGTNRIDRNAKEWVATHDNCRVVFDLIRISKRESYFSPFKKYLNPFSINVQQ